MKEKARKCFCWEKMINKIMKMKKSIYEEKRENKYQKQ